MGKIILRGILSGIVILITMMIPGMLCAFLVPGYKESYENYQLFRTMDDPRSYLFLLFPIVTGIGLSWLWSRVRTSFQAGESAMARGFSLGILYFFAAIIPNMMVTYASFQVTKFHILVWSLNGLVSSICGGIVLALMDKEKPAPAA
jgi:hypothetical protein